MKNWISRRQLALMGVAVLGTAATMFATTTTSLAEDVVLKVYTALEEEQLPPYKEAFEKANSGIVIEWQRDSTGVIAARLLAEKENRQADVVWGLAATSLMVLDKEGMLESYRPAGFDQIKDDFKDLRSGWPTWVGMDAWASAICSTRSRRKSWACRSRPAGRTCSIRFIKTRSLCPIRAHRAQAS